MRDFRLLYGYVAAMSLVGLVGLLLACNEKTPEQKARDEVCTFTPYGLPVCKFYDPKDDNVCYTVYGGISCVPRHVER